MGDAGQIWFTDVGNENGEYECLLNLFKTVQPLLNCYICLKNRGELFPL